MMIRNNQNMMRRMLKRAARARREHGIALLFTLCILSMALITAMIFSTNASTGRMVASAYVDSSAAWILADGVVNRAILALMKSENAGESPRRATGSSRCWAYSSSAAPITLPSPWPTRFPPSCGSSVPC